MSDYTSKEVEAAVVALSEDESEGNEWQDENVWSEIAYGDGPDTLTLRGEEVPLVHVTQVGGSGEGENIWCVFQLGDQLFRKEGYYASHYGSDWDGDLYECEIAERMVKFYDRKNK